MSDVNYEEQRQEKMASLFSALLGNVLCAGIGWIIACVGFLGVSYYGSMLWGSLLGLAGMGIIAAPLLPKWMATGSVKALFNMREYEVITTYSDGRRTSDYGLESTAINLVLKLIFAGIIFVLSLIVQLIRILIMLIKYVALFTKAQQKPPFIKTAFFILILGVVCFILGIALGAGIQKAGDTKTDTRLAAEAGMTLSEYRAKNKADQKAKEDAFNAVIEASKKAAAGTISAKVLRDYSKEGTPINSEPVRSDTSWDTVAIWVKAGSVLTITGEAIQGDYGSTLIPVEYEGIKGYIDAKYLEIE